MKVHERLNEYVDQGNIIIDDIGFFTTEYHTHDNRLVVTSKRYGGGFTMGTTVYNVTIDGITTQHDTLKTVYDLTLSFVQTYRY